MFKFYIPRQLPNKLVALKKQLSLLPQPVNYFFLQKKGFTSLTQMIPQHLPKYYADINSKMPAEYWDYENFENTWGSFYS